MKSIERTAVPLKCSICGNDIASPGTYMASVTHGPNEGEYFHTHCWKARQAPPVPAEVGELTPEFAAMNGRDKWETLVLNGLIGTDEPWIAAMRDTLRAEASLLERYAAALEKIADVWALDAVPMPKGRKWHCQHEEWLSSAASIASAALQTKP